MPVSQVTHQGTACGPPQRLGHAALFDQGRGKGQMTCARRPSPRISAGELPGRTDRPWLSPSNTAEHRREDARRPSLGGSRWPSEDVSRQLDLPKKDGTVHNTVLSHWTNSKKLFLINGLGAAFCFLRPLQSPSATADSCFQPPARSGSSKHVDDPDEIQFRSILASICSFRHGIGCGVHGRIPVPAVLAV